MAIRMKMKQKKMRKIGTASALGLVVLVMLGLYGGSNYMLNYSLNYPKEERMTAEHWKNRMKNECPWMIGWMDSVYQHHCVKDTFVVMPGATRRTPSISMHRSLRKRLPWWCMAIKCAPRECCTSPISIITIWGIMCSCQICMDTERARGIISRWDGRIDGMSSDGRKSPMRFLK